MSLRPDGAMAPRRTRTVTSRISGLPRAAPDRTGQYQTARKKYPVLECRIVIRLVTSRCSHLLAQAHHCESPHLSVILGYIDRGLVVFQMMIFVLLTSARSRCAFESPFQTRLRGIRERLSVPYFINVITCSVYARPYNNTVCLEVDFVKSVKTGELNVTLAYFGHVRCDAVGADRNRTTCPLRTSSLWSKIISS